MGFRDIRVFNSALLEKQIWRIHVGECPLLTAILKARYFKHSDVLDASRDYDPKYTWRSFWGSNLFMEGLVWQVGNRLSINPLSDKWIIVNGVACGLDSSVANNNLLRVSDFIDFHNGHWNLDNIGHNVYEETRKAILSIPLSLS